MSTNVVASSRFGSLSSIVAVVVLACSTIALAVPSLRPGADMPGCLCNVNYCTGSLNCTDGICCCCQDTSGPTPWPPYVCSCKARDDCDGPPEGMRCQP